MSSLTLIDELIGCLTRDGARFGQTRVLVPNERIPHFHEFFRIIGATQVSDQKYLEGFGLFSLGDESSLHALKLSRAYYEVLMDSFPKFQDFSLESQLEAYKNMASWSMESFVKNAKYFTAVGMARFLRNPLPERPTTFKCHMSLFSGALRRLYKNRVVSFNKHNCSFFLGLLQGVKRGAETVPKSFIREALLKHRATLSKPYSAIRNTSWFERVEMSKLFDRFFKKFRSVTPKLFEASASAGTSSKRSEGGARQFLRNYYYGPEAQSEMNLFSTSELIHMSEESSSSVVQYRGSPTWGNLEELLQELRLDPDFTSRHSHSNVRVSAVLEPLKVRLVTCGNEVSYYISRFYQKALWGYLQRFPQFSPTGRPIREEDFHDLLAREDRVFRNTNKVRFRSWNSGDYSAATDNLKISYTKDAFKASFNHLGFSQRIIDILESVLYEQKLHYPRDYEKLGGLEPIDQTSGQLMGSTLSFPILCIVNLCSYWLSLEQYLDREVSLLDLPVLVNGDDILFRTNPEFSKIWLRNISEVGFTLSLGKNYVSDNFLTINSEGWIFHPVSRTFDQIGYLNVGLLTGQSKLARRPEDLKPVHALYNQVLKGATNRLRTHRRFLHYHKQSIKEVTANGNFNLFLSPVVGGCGFDLYPEVSSTVKYTYFQKKLARFIYDKVLNQDYPSYDGPTKLQAFRLPLMRDDLSSKAITISKKQFKVYRFIPVDQPLNSREHDVMPPSVLTALNSGIIDTEKKYLSLSSFPIKTLMSFREEMSKDLFRGSRLPKNGLFHSLKLKVISVDPEPVSLPTFSEPFDINQYID